MSSLPRSSPTAQGVDPGALLAVLDALESDAAIELHSLMVLRHGHVVAEGWWAPYTSVDRPLLHSLSKSFLSTAVAFARAEGLLELDDTVLSHLPEYDAAVTHPRTRGLTLRQLLTMASGHDRDLLHEVLQQDPADPLRGFLTIPPDAEPGTLFAYNQPCSYTLAAVVQRRAGATLTDYLRPRLFDPLGIGEVGWQAHPPGQQLGFTGLHARTEDIARLGQLYLQDGLWEGRQLLPEGWVAEASRTHVDNAGQQPGKPDWQQGYGYHFWVARHGYRGDGAFGQFCVVLPEHDAVVATTGGTEAMQAVLDILWTHLLPGFDREPDNPAATETALRRRLTSLELDAAECRPNPVDASAWDGMRVGVAAGTHPTPLEAIEVTRRADGWALTLVEGDDRMTVPFAADDWLAGRAESSEHGVSVPVAACGGWRGETLHVELTFLESAHRMDVDIESGRATAAWRTRPFNDPSLRDLRCPD